MTIEAPGVSVRIAGRYELGERLGAGGMAVVYRATDDVLGRQVAIKLFGPAVDADHPERIQTEMRTLASLSHPGLVSVYDAGTDEQPGGDARAYLVMELIDGPTLADCARSGPLAPERVREIGACVAEALAYMHGRDVVHRDIKPANIILDAAGSPHLTDFGVARTIGAERHTATGMTIGTAAYLSPEQVTGGELTPAVDVYALGLTLLESITARREYPGAIAESALARLTRPPEIPPLPAPWPDLLARMTALEPQDRPTPDEVASILRGTDEFPILTQPVQTALPIQAAVEPFPATVLIEQAPVRDPFRLPLVLAGLLAAIVLVALALSATGGGSHTKVSPAPTDPPSKAKLDQDLTRLNELVSR